MEHQNRRSLPIVRPATPPTLSGQGDGVWQEAARCRTVDPDLFFHPEGERAAARTARLRRARQVCMQCPVIRECAAFAVAGREGFGIWGGLSEDERIVAIVSVGERPRGRSIHAARFDEAMGRS
ncbi:MULTISPECIES: WhiB family transcriptional regulator [unclassified Mycolicibacterium]|jgi:hypothetical protein|uniref:WhiB family transcriptional regulator n=1 Tax=unclassified Mycolicibacterium TaxID=2636767 RepID=UPI001F4BD0B9|nr:WhiB family transcriptional regulator [Mycolicibacterium sp. YH-1]UNB52312.1 WhiB family transcriptional regulator [Mycolicibacterium sp. YH-1]